MSRPERPRAVIFGCAGPHPAPDGRRFFVFGDTGYYALRSDGSANEKLYGRKLSAREIIREGKVGVPACARELDGLLNSKSPVNRSDPKSLQ